MVTSKAVSSSSALYTVEMQTPDIVLYGRDSLPALTVEVKAVRHTTPEWAAQYRENLQEYALSPRAPCFLLATADQFYFWSDAQRSGKVAPDLVLDATDLLQSYLKTLKATDLSGDVLQIVTRSWLNALAQPSARAQLPEALSTWTKQHGVQDALAGGWLD